MEKFSDSLGNQLNIAARWMRITLEKELAGTGITPSMWMIIMALGEKNNQGQTELGKMVNLDNATITRLLDKLQEMSLLVRNQDKEDRRAQKVSLTRKGQKMYHELNAIGKRVNDQASKNLSLKDIKKLLEWLEVINLNLNSNHAVRL